MSDREELAALRRLAELEAKAGNAAPAPDSVPFNGRAAMDTVKALPGYFGSALSGALQGAGDLVVGAGQLASHAMPQGMTDRFTNYMQQRENVYQGERQDSRPDIGRMTGSIVPGMILGGGPAAATLPGRMYQGAKVGLGLGLATPTNPDSENFLTDKAVQTGISTAAGGLAPGVVEPLIKGLGATVNFFGRQVGGLANTVSGKTTPGAIESTLKVELERNGVDWSKLGDESRAQMVGEVQKALKSGGQLDTAAISRLADFEKAGIKNPTQAQLTRNPYQYAQEQNLSKMEVGQPLASKFNEQNTAMMGALEKARGVPDEYDAGKSVIGSMLKRDAPRKTAVTDAYNEFKGMVGANAEVPPQQIAGALGNVIEEHGAGKIPADVMSRLKEFGLMGGTQTKSLDLKQSEILRKLVSNNTTFENSAAMKIVKQSIDDAVNGMEASSGGAAASIKNARELAGNRLTQIDRTPALENALGRSGETVAPEKFIDKFIVRGEVQDVANNLRAMTVEGRDAARTGVMTWLQKQATNGTGDAAKFSQSGFNKALESIGDRKLDLIFAGDKATLEQLRALGRVGTYVQSPPIASGVNYSNSGTTMLDAMDKMTRLPVIGAISGKPSDLIRASQVAKALGGGAPVNPMHPALAEELLKRAGRLGSRVGSPIAGAMSPWLIQGLAQ